MFAVRGFALLGIGGAIRKFTNCPNKTNLDLLYKLLCYIFEIAPHAVYTPGLATFHCFFYFRMGHPFVIKIHRYTLFVRGIV